MVADQVDNDANVGGDVGDIGNVDRAAALKLLGADRGDRNGHVDQRFFAAAGGDDDLADGRILGESGRCNSRNSGQ